MSMDEEVMKPVQMTFQLLDMSTLLALNPQNAQYECFVKHTFFSFKKKKKRLLNLSVQ